MPTVIASHNSSRFRRHALVLEAGQHDQRDDGNEAEGDQPGMLVGSLTGQGQSERSYTSPFSSNVESPVSCAPSHNARSISARTLGSAG